MKKIIAFIPVWLLYYLGDLISYSFKYDLGFISEILFYIYNYCMIWSGDLQDWACLKKPWLNIENLEIERRWVLKHLPDNIIFNDLILIEQYYSPSGRYRKCFNGYEVTYYHTIKKDISPGVKEEIEKEITKDEFKEAIKSATSYLAKHRYILNRNDLVFEIDGILFNEMSRHPNLWIMEVELDSINQKIEIPQELQEVIIKEITDDKACSNHKLSIKI